jgi:hypothetical protein
VFTGYLSMGRLSAVSERICETEQHVLKQQQPQLFPRFIPYRIPRGGHY